MCHAAANHPRILESQISRILIWLLDGHPSPMSVDEMPSTTATPISRAALPVALDHQLRTSAPSVRVSRFSVCLQIDRRTRHRGWPQWFEGLSRTGSWPQQLVRRLDGGRARNGWRQRMAERLAESGPRSDPLTDRQPPVCGDAAATSIHYTQSFRRIVEFPPARPVPLFFMLSGNLLLLQSWNLRIDASNKRPRRPGTLDHRHSNQHGPDRRVDRIRASPTNVSVDIIPDRSRGGGSQATIDSVQLELRCGGCAIPVQGALCVRSSQFSCRVLCLVEGSVEFH